MAAAACLCHDTTHTFLCAVDASADCGSVIYLCRLVVMHEKRQRNNDDNEDFFMLCLSPFLLLLMYE